jgi:hypothetical protein
LVREGITYWYTPVVFDSSGASTVYTELQISVTPGAPPPGVVWRYSLSAYPNPFNSGTTLHFVLEHHENVKIEVYDLHGRSVQTVTDQDYLAGDNTVTFDASRLATGLYFARISTPHYEATHKLLLLK